MIYLRLLNLRKEYVETVKYNNKGDAIRMLKILANTPQPDNVAIAIFEPPSTYSEELWYWYGKQLVRYNLDDLLLLANVYPDLGIRKESGYYDKREK